MLAFADVLCFVMLALWEWFCCYVHFNDGSVGVVLLLGGEGTGC